MGFLSLNSQIIDTVIFDFDGTLAKLNIDFDHMRHVVDHLISLHGIDSQRLQNGYVLEKIRESETILHNQSPIRAKSFRAEAFGMIETIEVEAAQRGELFELTRHILTELRQNAINTGIITRNCARAVHTVFPDISSYCTVIICRDDVRHVKPHPDHITAALQKLGSDPRTSLMVGDHPLDIETGRNAGTLTAGVLSGNCSEHDFLKVGADIVLPRAADVLTRLKHRDDHPFSG